jgi:hypothetical protein
MDPAALLAEVSSETVQVCTQLADRPLNGAIVQGHVRDRRHIDLGAFDLTDGCPKDLALFAPCSMCG